MRILYGVVGEGMGHATRSRVALEHLLEAGHEVRVVVSGRAHAYLRESFRTRAGIAIDEIHGLHLSYDGNALDLSESIRSNLAHAGHGLLWNVATYSKLADQHWEPQVVLSDFESWAYLYGLNHRLPVISIDNMQVLNRCRHGREVTENRGLDFLLAKTAVKMKLPGAYHYLVTSFFFPPVRKPYTTLIPPILRAEILSAVREPGEHVLVYQTAASNQALVPTLQRLSPTFRVYGVLPAGETIEQTHGNVTLCRFSPTQFVEDLRTARAVIAGGGYSLMGEAVHLRVPMLSVPISGQYEQVLNAHYLEKLGYGLHAPELDEDRIADFLARSAEFTRALGTYEPRDNRMLFACLDELLRDVELDEPRPPRLGTRALGCYDGPLLPEELIDD